MGDIALALFDFETERLRLRPLELGDEALFHDLYTDPQTMRFIAKPFSAEQATRQFRKTIEGMHVQPFKWLSLVILEKVSRQPLGICGMSQFDASAVRQEVGILLNAEARSRGFAREGLAALIGRIFAVLPIHEVWVEFSADCPAVQRLNISLGFKPCADVTGEEGLLSKCIWSVHRSSWCAIETTNCQGGI